MLPSACHRPAHFASQRRDVLVFRVVVRPAFEKHKNSGVRIEDEMLVTATGGEWMTGALPRSIADIEAFMARAPKELRSSALEMLRQASEILPPTLVALNARKRSFVAQRSW